MTKNSSVSEVQTSQWNYIRTGPGRSGRSLSENNFAKEKRDWLAILLREVLQNALDARKRDELGPVSVSIRLNVLDELGRKLINHLIPPAHLDRFKESMPHLGNTQVNEIETCLVVEDFGTTGLTGAIDNPDLDAQGQNWNAFWFREGEGGKEAASGNGGAGQGKITYFSSSAIRTLLAYTVRSDDQVSALFGASSFLRDYQYDSVKWRRDAYLGVPKGESWEERVYLPICDESEIGRFIEAFKLGRDKSMTGLSLVIPSPKKFEITEAIEIVIAEFFVPIHRGDLTVRLGDKVLDKASIGSMANAHLGDERARELHTCTTRSYRQFLVDAIKNSISGEMIGAKSADSFSDASFSEEDAGKMKVDLQAQKIISVRVPLQVKKKTGEKLDCTFEVHLQCPYELDRPEQAIFRKDLLVGEEPIGGGRFRQRVRGAVFINDSELSRLLLTAEEATHLRWNAKLPRLSEYYRSGPDVVSTVRNAMARLLEYLTGGDQKKDFKLLAKYFSAPGTTPTGKNKGSKKTTDGRGLKVPEIPPPKPKLLCLDTFDDGCSLRAIKPEYLDSSLLPLAATVEFAYEGLDKDAFAEYDPLDFDVSDDNFKIKMVGCEALERGNNAVKLLVTKADFNFEIRGFDKNLRLRVRVTYKESADAALVDAE